MKKTVVFLLLLSLALLCACSENAYDPTLSPSELISDPVHSEMTVSVSEPLPEDTVITFAGCGDNIMYNGNISDAKKLAAGTDRAYDFSPIYENIKPIIEKADIAFINQETPLAGEEFGYDDYPRFNSPRELADDIINAGFDVINIATNHMLDAGSSGLMSTIEFWNTMPVTLIGGYLNEEDFDNIRIVEKNGIKIAFLAFTYSTNGIPLRSDYDIVIPYEDSEVISEQIKKADEASDLIIASMHWGNEYSFTPSSNQRELASMMAELGVDAVIGHHPHVLQPIEWVDGKDGHKMLCAYSLGNIAAEQASDANYVGGILTFDIVREKGECSVKNPLFLPTAYYFNRAFRKNSIHLMENFTEEMSRSHGISYYGKSTSIEKLRSYVTKTISAEFLPDSFK